MSSQLARSIDAVEPLAAMPAHATTVSSPSNASAAAVVAACTDASSRTSHTSGRAQPPAAATSAATGSGAPARTSATATLAPSAARRSALARPIPLPPPVTSARRPARRGVVVVEKLMMNIDTPPRVGASARPRGCAGSLPPHVSPWNVPVHPWLRGPLPPHVSPWNVPVHPWLRRKAEHPFSDDVPLDLVGSAGDSITRRAEHMCRPGVRAPFAGVGGEAGPEQPRDDIRGARQVLGPAQFSDRGLGAGDAAGIGGSGGALPHEVGDAVVGVQLRQRVPDEPVVGHTEPAGQRVHL